MIGAGPRARIERSVKFNPIAMLLSLSSTHLRDIKKLVEIPEDSNTFVKAKMIKNILRGPRQPLSHSPGVAVRSLEQSQSV